MSDYDKRIDAIVERLLSAATDAPTSEGRDGVVELTQASVVLAVRMCLAAGGGVQNGRAIFDQFAADLFAQAAAEPAP